MPWKPGEPHADPDPNLCPRCGQKGRFQENNHRVTWQSVTLGYEDGTLTGADWGSFSYCDEAPVDSYDCSCGAEWASLRVLAREQRIRKALEDNRDFYAGEWDDAVSTEDLDSPADMLADAKAVAFQEALNIMGNVR
jgi:hypothetical protein